MNETWLAALGIGAPSVLSILGYLIQLDRRISRMEGKIDMLLRGDPNGKKKEKTESLQSSSDKEREKERKKERHRKRVL